MKKLMQVILIMCAVTSLLVCWCGAADPAAAGTGEGNETETAPAAENAGQTDTEEAGLKDELSGGYIDVPEDMWYYSAVMYVSDAGLMQGVGDGLFEPEKKLTRAMFAQILYNICGGVPVSGSGFADVAEDAWYCGAVGWANSAGLIQGYGDGMFGPEEPVSRQDLAVMLWRLAQYQERDVTGAEAVELTRFPDCGNLAAYAEPAMKWVCGTGIMQGEADGRLNPAGSATRAQIAAVLTRYTDPEQAQIAELLTDNPEQEQARDNTGKRHVVVLDPGHGKISWYMSDQEKLDSGYVQNASGAWGEWKHYAVGSGWDECLGIYCSRTLTATNGCFYLMVNGDRLTEPEINLANGLAARHYLEAMGYEVRMTRTTEEENPSITRRLSFCFPDNDSTKAPDADIFVCLHSNAGGATGSAYISLAGTYDQAWIPADYVEKSNRLGYLCNSAIVENTSLRQCGSGVITFEPNLIAFCKSPVPCGYLEIGFFDAPSDLAILRAESDRIGYAIAQGIHRYFQTEEN